MPAKESHLRIPGQIEHIRSAVDFVATAAEESGFDERGVYHCQLAVDEACTNVAEHGYGDNNLNGFIDVFCRDDGEYFSISIVDDSPAYNPLLRADPNPSAGLEDRETGGWGVYFIKKLMDDIQYEYAGGRNKLIMVKRRP